MDFRPTKYAIQNINQKRGRPGIWKRYYGEGGGMRVYPDADGNLTLRDGDYGQDKEGIWYVKPPGQHMGTIEDHTVREHKDGTITVSPSIVVADHLGRRSWHGYLRKGKWKSI